MRTISFSKFNKLCKFCKQVIVDDGFGGQIITWNEVYQAWGQISPIIPDKKSQGLKLSHPWTHRMYTRYSSFVKPHMKLVCNEQEYILDKVINIAEQGEFIEAMMIRVEL